MIPRNNSFTLPIAISNIIALLVGCNTQLPPSPIANQEFPIVATTHQSHYPLHDAVSQNDLKRVKELLTAGGNYIILKINEKGKTPLRIAAERGYARILYTLLEYGNDVPGIKQNYGLFCEVIQQPYTDPETNYQLMRQAIANECTEVVYFLFRNGAMSYMKSEKGYDLLYQTIKKDYCEAFTLFLAQVPTFRPNRMVDVDGNTLLHLAAEKGALDIVWWLLNIKNNTKVNPNQYNVNRQTPLELTVKEQDRFVVINKPVAFALLCYGAFTSRITNQVRRQAIQNAHLAPDKLDLFIFRRKPSRSIIRLKDWQSI